jgi:O-antigen/teichoic acid export membrane protein
LAFAFPLFAILRIASAGSRSLKRIEYDVGVQQILQPALTFAFVSIAFLLGYRLLGAVGGFLLALMISALVAIWLLIRAFPELITRLAPIFEVRNFISFAVSLFLVGLSVNLLVQVDKLLLGFFLPAEQVGIYSVAATVARKTAIFLAAFGMIFEPIISDLYYRKQIVELESVFKTVTKWTISLTLPLCVVVALFSQEILAVFGSEFIAGKAVLIVLILGQLVNTSVGRVGSILIMTGKQNIELANSVITLVMVVLLNVLLIPPFGIRGAAVATSIGLSLVNIGRLLEVYGFLKIQPYQTSLWKPAVAALASIAFGLWIKSIAIPHYGLWVIQAAGVTAFYAFAMLILGFDQEDKLVLLTIRQKLEKGAR